jgi:predicted RNA-binding Zn-ribbon protein involved in translation (DUF1610 family)
MCGVDEFRGGARRRVRSRRGTVGQDVLVDISERGRVFQCEVCGRPTTRMFGFLGSVAPRDEGGGQRGVSLRSAINGYCRQHREQVATGFPDALRSEGEVGFLGEPPAELRPGTVPAFLAAVDEMRLSFIDAVGLPAGAHQGDLDAAPEACPHCGGELAWAAGPHVAEAASRGNAIAWECTGCGAAGLFMFQAP